MSDDSKSKTANNDSMTPQSSPALTKPASSLTPSTKVSNITPSSSPTIRIGPGLESAFTKHQPRLPGMVKSSIPRDVVTPVSIRSGGPKMSFTALQNVKKPTTLSMFTPNIHSILAASASQQSQKDGSGQTKLSGGSSAVVDIGAILANSLSYKTMRSGGAKDLHIQRSAVGALGARGNRFQAPSTVQAKVQQHLNSIRKKKGKSRDVMELSWAEGPGGHALYTPITLPYVIKTDINDEHQTEESNRRSKRPTVHFIDESNRNAATLFTSSEDDIDDDQQWYLVQFPEVLPALIRQGISNPLSNDHEQCSTRKTNDYGDIYYPSRLDGLPEGRLGSLEIHKSGRVTLVVGKHRFEVNQGSDCNFCQEVASLVGGNSELMFLGRCQKRIVIAPDIDYYVSA